MKPIYRSNLFMLVVVIGQIIGSVFLSQPLQKIFSYNQFLVVTQVLFLLIPVVLFLLATGLPAKQILKLNKISIEDIFIVIIIAIAAQPIASILSLLSSLFFENTVSEVMREMGNIPYIIQLIIIALTPAICEELTMRGVILSGYQRVSKIKAALATGLFFGILHMNPQQFLYAFALGVLFAYIVRITNSIFSTMICHFTFNSIQVTMAYLVTKKSPELYNQSGSIASLHITEKLMVFVPLLLWTALALYIIIRLVKRMEKMHSPLNTIYRTDSRYGQSPAYVHTGNNEERIINMPFVAVVVVYLVLMIVIQFLK